MATEASTNPVEYIGRKGRLVVATPDIVLRVYTNRNMSKTLNLIQRRDFSSIFFSLAHWILLAASITIIYQFKNSICSSTPTTSRISFNCNGEILSLVIWRRFQKWTFIILGICQLQFLLHSKLVAIISI